MRSGVCYPSRADNAAWTAVTGSWDANYPLSGLSDLNAVRSPAVSTAAGARSITFTFPSAVSIDFIAFIHHNAHQAGTFRVRLSGGTDPLTGVLHDSAVQSFWPSGAPSTLYPGVRPYRLTSPLTVRSGRIDFNETNPVPWEFGAIDIGTFWNMPDFGVDRAVGIESTAIVQDVGVDHVMKQWSPRIFSGKRETVAQSEIETTLMDFQRDTGFWKAFTWAWDLDDPTTCQRECYLARNAALAPGEVYEYNVGRMQLDLIEHLG